MGLQKVLYKALDAQNSGKLADAVRLCLAVPGCAWLCLTDILVTSMQST